VAVLADKVWVIELNPFSPTTGACLFDWEDDAAILKGSTECGGIGAVDDAVDDVIDGAIDGAIDDAIDDAAIGDSVGHVENLGASSAPLFEARGEESVVMRVLTAPRQHLDALLMPWSDILEEALRRCTAPAPHDGAERSAFTTPTYTRAVVGESKKMQCLVM
jgi:hypothetical protein